jgi:hypothetical protein
MIIINEGCIKSGRAELEGMDMGAQRRLFIKCGAGYTQYIPRFV